MASDPTHETPRPPPVDHELTRPPSADETHALDPANEKDLWHGRESWRTSYPAVMAWLIATIVAAVIAVRVRGLWGDVGWTLLVCAFVLGVLVLRKAVKIMSTSYRITTQRLFIRRGILSLTVDQVELLRVDDVRMRQTLLERVLGIGTVEVDSTAHNDPRVSLRGIAQPAMVTEHIRRHTRTLQKRTLFMEQI